MIEQGYTNVTMLPTGEVACLYKFMFTTGLIVGVTKFGYRIRFCFEQAQDAAEALKSWDGNGYPPGNWIKAKGTDDFGNLIDELNPNLEQVII